jgi:hypothetical protein
MTATSITLAELLALDPCDPHARKKLFGHRKSMTAKQALKAGVPIEDILWVASRLGRNDLCVRLALLCAQRVSHLNPDPRVHAALDATAAWLADPSEENRDAAGAAAWAAEAAAEAAALAAEDAAWAAWAAREAAKTAWAARDAAWEAAWAARAARAAAREAAGDAGAAELEAQKLILIEVFA